MSRKRADVEQIWIWRVRCRKIGWWGWVGRCHRWISWSIRGRFFPRRRLRAMKHSAMLRGIAHETRVGVIASATVIRIFFPFVTVFSERLGAASLRITWANATAILRSNVRCFYCRGVEVVGLQIVERGMIVVSGLSTRDHATKLVVKLENSRGRKRDGLFGQEFQVTAELLSLGVFTTL